MNESQKPADSAAHGSIRTTAAKATAKTREGECARPSQTPETMAAII